MGVRVWGVPVSVTLSAGIWTSHVDCGVVRTDYSCRRIQLFTIEDSQHQREAQAAPPSLRTVTVPVRYCTVVSLKASLCFSLCDPTGATLAARNRRLMWSGTPAAPPKVFLWRPPKPDENAMESDGNLKLRRPGPLATNRPDTSNAHLLRPRTVIKEGFADDAAVLADDDESSSSTSTRGSTDSHTPLWEIAKEAAKAAGAPWADLSGDEHRAEKEAVDPGETAWTSEQAGPTG